MKEFELSDGRKVVIKAARGHDAEAAMKIAGNGQPEKYLTILMARTVTIDGKSLIPEELSDLPLKDYTKIQGEFAEINF